MAGKKKPLLKKLGITALISVSILFVLTYIGISLFFEDHFYYNTYVNGQNFSYMTPVEAEEYIYQELYGYSLEITGREGIYDVILPAEIDMKCLPDDSFVKIKQKQRPALWFLGFFKEYSYELPGLTEYKEEALDQKLGQLSFFKRENIRAPSDAYLAYSEEEEQYVIVDASPGTELSEEKTGQVIAEALASLEKTVNLEEKGCYKTARVSGDNEELKEALEQANTYAAVRVTYDWNGNEIVVDGNTAREWIEIEGDTVGLNEEKVRAYIAELADIYDTYGRNKVFHTTDGREIELKSNAFGWQTDQETETAALIKSVKSGETISKQPAYSYTAAKEGQMDIGNSYVEMDLSKQHLYLYVDGELIVESDFVSGNASRGWNTPAGVFGLTYKTRNAVLRGDDYETPVSYWMPFNGNIGMHDATWRGSFGGDIYKTNGSHGCINLPYENAKIIYEYMYTGFPVVCYY